MLPFAQGIPTRGRFCKTKNSKLGSSLKLGFETIIGIKYDKFPFLLSFEPDFGFCKVEFWGGIPWAVYFATLCEGLEPRICRGSILPRGLQR